MKQALVNGRWNLWLPDNIADWDGITGDAAAHRGWEYERFESFRRELRYGDTFFDIGAEHGWISAIIAREFVGAENMVLFEPSSEFWVNIRKTWEYNGLADPRACWPGFVGCLDTGTIPGLGVVGWPDCADVSKPEVPGMAYRSLLDESSIPTTTLDYYIKMTSISPDVINIDVEGAELLVLQGAIRELSFGSKLRNVWISVHPDLMENFGHTPEMLHECMEGHGWEGTHLATDHEEHWWYTRG